MHRLPGAIVVLLFFVAVGCSRFHLSHLAGLPAVAGRPSLDSSQAQIVFTFAQRTPDGTQIALCFISGDSEKYVGVARRNDSLVYVENSDSAFEIGSITKTFTGTMLAKLVRDGRVALNEPIRNILPVPLKQGSLNGGEITLVQLANHTSGLPSGPSNVGADPEHPVDPYFPYRHYSVKKLYEYLSNDMVLVSTPGEKRLYSNLGGGLLGHLLTLIAGKPYEELMMETICAPLGMDNTFVSLTGERMKKMVRGRDPRGQILPFCDEACGALTGAGGVISSARDLAKYLMANMKDTTYFLLAQRETKRFDEHFSGGIGWGSYRLDGKEYVQAYGATAGYTSGVMFERRDRLGIAVLTNVSAFLTAEGNYTEELCRNLYASLARQHQK
jgi:CubicO group peptidase (beta-lactamase class C family)